MEAFSVVFIESYIYDLNGSLFNALKINLNLDVNRATINRSTLKVYNFTKGVYVENFDIAFDKKVIYVIDKGFSISKGDKVIVTLLGGENGIKNIFNMYNIDDVVREIIYDLDAPIQKPVIINPSTDELVKKGFEIGFESYGNPVHLVISDDVEFKNVIIDEIIYSTPYSPSFEFTNEKQYFIKLTSLKDGIESAAEMSSFIYFDQKQLDQNDDYQQAGTRILSFIPSDTGNILDRNEIIVQTVEPANIKVYKTYQPYLEIVKNNFTSFIGSMFVEEISDEKYTITSINNVYSIKLNEIEYSKKTDRVVYVVHLVYQDDQDELLCFVAPRRQLYITLQELKPHITSFEYNIEDLFAKIEHACDEVDYYSIKKVKTSKIDIYVKDFIITYIVLYLLDEYIKGNINIVKGTIGTFSFDASSQSYSIIKDLYSNYKAKLIEHRNALYKQIRPGYAPPAYTQYAVSDITRQNI